MLTQSKTVIPIIEILLSTMLVLRTLSFHADWKPAQDISHTTDCTV